MSDDITKLIAEARQFQSFRTWQYPETDLVRKLTDSLESVTAERDAANTKLSLWEYGLRSEGDDEPYSDIATDLDYLIDEAGSSIQAGDHIVRRYQAGTWEPLPREEER